MRGAALVDLCVREHGGGFLRLMLNKLFSYRVSQLSRRALGHKGPPTQLHALPPFIEITPALMNSNLLPRVSAREPWQGIIHLVRSLARFDSSQHARAGAAAGRPLVPGGEGVAADRILCESQVLGNSSQF